MDIETLGSSPVGTLVPIHGRDAKHGDFAYFAFLPEPLPDDLQLQSATWTAVTRASMAMARLDQLCSQLPDPKLLIRPALWREALDTNALEGTVGALKDLLEAQLPSAQFLSPETVEIRAYERVALHAFHAIEHRPISVSLLSDMQGELLANAREKPKDLGKPREDPVWIGERNQPIHDSRFVPCPPGDRLLAGLQAWETWVQADLEHLPPVLRAALAHYQFETLHPYGDGNGRLGRLVIVLQLLKSGAIQHPGVTVSPWFLKHREAYQNHLLAVSRTGDWDPWIQFFCQAIEDQCELMGASARSLLVWLEESRTKVNDKRWTGAIHSLLQDLIEWPVTTVADTATRHGVSPMNATRMINHLVEVGVLRELTGRSYGRVFGAQYVMDTVERMH